MSYFPEDRVTASDQPQNNMELMVDIESLGTIPGAPVVTIGAVLFDPYKCDSSQLMLDRSINLRVDLADSVKFSTMGDNPEDTGRTLRWWFEQSDAAIKALVVGECISMQEALIKLSRYCLERGAFVNKEFFEGLSELPKACRFWAKDPDFDMRLLQHYYDHPQLKGAKQPWDFWACRSVRTIQDLAWPEGGIERPHFEVPGVAHDARWDAIQQAMTVQAAIHRLGLSADQDVEFEKYEPPGGDTQ